MDTTELDLVVAGTQDAVMMVESEAKELTEDEMLGAVLFAHQEMQVAIETIKALAAEAGQLQLNVMEPVIADCILESQTMFMNAAISL